MQLLFDLETHFSYLRQCVLSQPSLVALSSYGIWAGILQNGADTSTFGDKYKSLTRDFLESLKEVDEVHILIGNYQYKSCAGKSKCLDCEKKYIYSMIRLLNHADAFPSFQWKLVEDSHLKCAIFHYNDGSVRGVTGGRNLTDSNWSDVSVVLDKGSIYDLYNFYSRLWRSKEIITSDQIGGILESQGISEEAISTIT